MSEILFGVKLDPKTPAMEFRIPKDSILIWRDSPQPEVVFCDKKSDIPNGWMRSECALKILGEFKTIKSILGHFEIPPASKVIDLSADSLVFLSLPDKLIRFQGVRFKRVVVVDDSPTIRKLLTHIIKSFENWNVVAEVEDPKDIPKAMSDFYPDLVTLDLNLGEMNGVEALRKFLAPIKMPTILITSQAIKDGSLVMEALSAGALDYMQKPESGKWDLAKEELLLKFDTALRAKWNVTTLKSSSLIKPTTYNFDPSKYIILIGSSTGGTQALQEIFVRLPVNIPPILVTQHIPAGFSKALAERLNSLCPFEIKEAVSGDEIRPGRILIAPGDHHMKMGANGKSVIIVDEAPVNRFRPSVEAMFSSFAGYKHSQIIAVMLTGMGKDGAQAMLELKNLGALTVAQDEQSSVVFGMPKEAIRLGAAVHVKSLLDIPQFLQSLMAGKVK